MRHDDARAPGPTPSGEPVDVAVVASLKRGFEQFIHREIRHLESLGARVTIYPTKHGRGPLGPEPTWPVHGWTVRAVLLAQPARLVRSPRRYGRDLLHAVSLGGVVEWLLAEYFADAVARHDVIYTTFGDRKLFVGYFCKRITGRPLVTEIHAYELYSNPNPRLFVEALAACDHIVVPTEHNRDVLAERHGVDPGRVEVVRYSIDLDEYRPEDRFVILIVAFFVERKGHDVLFRAVQELDDDAIEVWVVGDEGAEARSVDVRAMAHEMGLADQVAFFGRLSGTALRAVYRACDVFCLPCHFDRDGVGEGFPNVIIEAMALGKPVITTRHVEIPRVLDAVLVDENDVRGLADAIRSLRHDVVRRAELGRDNRAVATRAFSPANAGRTLTVLRAAAAAGPLTEPRPNPRGAGARAGRRPPGPGSSRRR